MTTREEVLVEIDNELDLMPHLPSESFVSI
jgi:hypothetical protein